MKKGTKKIIWAIIAIIVILALAWLVYESVKPETVSIGATNELPNENMGMENSINELSEEIETNTEVTNEVAKNEVVAKEEKPDKKTEEKKPESEIVSGNKESREERAVELAKEYYEEEYGSSDGIYFEYDSINEDGRYIVRAGTADTGTIYLLVDLDTEDVSEDY